MVARLKRIKKRTWTQVAVGLLLAIGLVAGLQFLTIQQFLPVSVLARWVEEARSNPWFALFFYLIFIFAVLALPITLFPIIGGVLLDFRWALPLNLFAATAGAWFAFVLARFCGRRWVVKLLQGQLKSLDRITATQGLKAVFLFRFVGIPPFTVANYALGLSAIKSKDFLLGTLLGLGPWMAVITYTSNSLWQVVLDEGEKGLAQALFGALKPLMILSMAVLTSTLVTFYFRKRRLRIQESVARSIGSEKPTCL